MSVNIQTHFGSMDFEPADIIWLSRKAPSSATVILLKGGKSISTSEPIEVLAKRLDIHLAHEDPTGLYHVNESAIVRLKDTLKGLVISLEDGHLIMVEGGTTAMFNHSLAVGRAVREGKPVPPPPAGVTVSKV